MDCSRVEETLGAIAQPSGPTVREKVASYIRHRAAWPHLTDGWCDRSKHPMRNSQRVMSTNPVRYKVRRPKFRIRNYERIVPRKEIAVPLRFSLYEALELTPACWKKYIVENANWIPQVI